jgi:hypothetical protein
MFLIFLFLGLSIGLSQSESVDIAGSYHKSSKDPHGGSHLIITPNNTFVVTYFGGMRKGTWLENDDGYEFTYHTEPEFVVYARHNPSITDSVIIRAHVDAVNGDAIRINPKASNEFRLIFNEHANCFSYPYIYKHHQAIESLDLYTANGGNYREGAYQDTSETYYNYAIDLSFNELILTGLPPEYSVSRSFKANYNNGSLSIANAGSLNKTSEYAEINKEELDYINRYIKNDVFPKVLNSNSEFFPRYDDPIESELTPFIRVDSEKKEFKNIRINPNSMFTAVCELIEK